MKQIIKKLTATALLSSALFQASAGVFEPVRDEQVPAGDPYAVVQPPIESPQLFKGKRVAILASHGVEETEIVFPYTYLSDRGAKVDVLVPDWTPKGIVASLFLKPTIWVKASGTFSQGQSQEYDLVVLTGGAWNAQVVRSDPSAIKLITDHFLKDKPLAAICAGTSVLINAGIAKGTRLTGSPVVAPDLINAGAKFADEAAVVDGNLLTSRTPNDLPAFVNGLRKQLIGR